MITPTVQRWSVLTCAAALALGALAGCGGDDNESEGGGGTAPAEQTTPSKTGGGGATATLAQEAVEAGGLAFSQPNPTVQAGSVKITLTNPSGNQLPHAIEVEGNGVEEETDTIEPGGEASVTVDLEPGTYEFYCPVDNHRGQGMEGTLTVE
jgi:plastocyanin